MHIERNLLPEHEEHLSSDLSDPHINISSDHQDQVSPDQHE